MVLNCLTLHTQKSMWSIEIGHTSLSVCLIVLDPNPVFVGGFQGAFIEMARDPVGNKLLFLETLKLIRKCCPEVLVDPSVCCNPMQKQELHT